MKCFYLNCKEKKLRLYENTLDEPNYREIISCMVHKPMGWRRVKKEHDLF